MKTGTHHPYALRKMPYPYRAMFAIASDVDGAVSQSAYLDFMTYLNTDRDTCYGRGLNLEVGNSFWFFNAVADEQMSYFQGTSSAESAFALPCRELWQSGHIDMLHSYGDFNNGGFTRGLAEMAVNECIKQGFHPTVWVNHGNDNNHQNVGNIPPFQGGQSDSEAYHLDLLRELGTRFFWTGRITHVAGQDAAFSVGNQFQQKLQKLVLKTKYRKIQRPLPDPPNRLLIRTEMADGSHVIDFQRFISRFGDVKNTDLVDLALQLSEGNLASLVKSEGFMLLYTHMNEHLPEKAPLPESVVRGFERLKAYGQRQSLLITTASRLLGYADLLQHLTWTHSSSEGLEELHLDRDDHLSLSGADLQGLTLYCPHPEKTLLLLDGASLPVQINPRDALGRASISVPWSALEYPL